MSDTRDLVLAVRGAGVEVPTDATILLTAALAELEPLDVRSLYWAGHATLVRHHDDLARYDEAFVAFVAGAERSESRPDDGTEIVRERAVQVLVLVDDSSTADEPADEAEVDDADPDAPPVLRASAFERLADRDFAGCTDAELAELGRAVDRLRWTSDLRPSRRRRPGGSGRDRLDLRRTTAAALSTDGELLVRHHRSRVDRPRRLVLLADVSGSMEPYARMLLRLGHAAVTSRRHAEVFTVGTRVTRVTRALAPSDPDAALDAASELVADWAGGTRLADGIGGFLDGWGRRGMARGAVVVILSDGWERGDPADLAERMRQLAALAHRVVWVNPLRASEGYEPLAGGMAAALPHVDDFLDGHSLRSLEALAALVGR